MSEFPGFDIPDQNWFKVPNEWTDIASGMTLAERAVVMYVLRHTWGYREFNKSKSISTDEFEHGRKRKDGTRIDKGTGLSRMSILKGIRNAVENGYLKVEEDRTDLGRMKKKYSLRMYRSDVKKVDTDVEKLDAGGLKNRPRTEKDTLERQPKKDKNGRKVFPPRFCNGFSLTKFDMKVGVELHAILVKFDSDLVITTGKKRGVRKDTLAKNSFRLRTERSVSEERIKKVVKWLRDHYHDTYTPQFHKAEDFFVKWKKFEDAMERSTNGKGSETGFQKYLERVNGNGQE